MSEKSHTSNRAANVLIAVLIVLLVCSAIVAAYLSFSAHEARLTRIVAEEEGAFAVAEAGLDYGLAKLKSVLMAQKSWVEADTNELQKIFDAIPPPPPRSGEYVYRTPSGVPAFRLRVESDAVRGAVTNGPADFSVEGVWQRFSVTCGALNPRTGIGCVLKRQLRALEIPMIRFVIFGAGDTAIVSGNTLDVHGPVHVNGDLVVGGSVTFHGQVEAAGRILLDRGRSTDKGQIPRFKNIAGELLPMVENDEVYDSQSDVWAQDALRRWNGNVLSGEHGVQKWIPPGAWAMGRAMIERVCATNDVRYNEKVEAEKFASRAAIRFHVLTDGMVIVEDSSGNDLSARFSNVVLKVGGETNGVPLFVKRSETGEYLFDTNAPSQGIYDVCGLSFFDFREKTVALPVDVYVDLLQAAMTNLYGPGAAGPGSNIVYITRDDPDGVLNGVLPCVRLRNAARIFLKGGLTVASDLPVYIEGDVNLDIVEPLLVAGDSVTFLSKSWQDAYAQGGVYPRISAQTTTYNLAVIGGGAGASASPVNGLRILEDWTAGAALNFNGSFIDLWKSSLTTGRWDDVGFPVPAMTWRYDDTYRSKSPPGVARVRGVEELRWERTTWAREGW